MSAVSRLSSSGAELFESCPAKWKAKYVDGVVDVPGDAAIVGSLSHSVLEKLFALPAANRSVTAARWLLGSEGGEFSVEQRRLAWGFVLNGLRMEDPAGVDVVGIEVELAGVEIAGVPFVGFIDRVEADPFGGVRVVDYKTGRRPAPAFMDPKRRQVTLYALGWEALGNERVESAAVMWLKTSKVDEVSLVQTRDSTAEWFGDKWAGIASSLDSGVFEVKPGPLCGWCPVLDSCVEGLGEVRLRLADGRNVGPGVDVLSRVEM